MSMADVLMMSMFDGYTSAKKPQQNQSGRNKIQQTIKRSKVAREKKKKSTYIHDLIGLRHLQCFSTKD